MRGLRIFETRRARALRKDAPKAERILWKSLRNRHLDGFKFVRQEPIGIYFADFVCRERKLIIEVDGETHSTEKELAHDCQRTADLEANGYRVIRFINAQLFENVEAVEQAILRALVVRKD